MRQPTRTDLVEEHQRKVTAMRYRAIDMTTTARHYGSIAESIEAIPAEGGVFFVDARADVAEYARQRQQQCLTAAHSLKADADRMEERGLE